MIRVLVVDDHAFVRAAVTALLADCHDIEVVGQCGDGSEVPSSVQACRPHVVVMDHEMPQMTGLEASAALRLSDPSVRVVMHAASLTEAALLRAADTAGAVGYVAKGSNPQLLVEAIRAADPGSLASLQEGSRFTFQAGTQVARRTEDGTAAQSGR